eukprot:m.56205 g.56205  ORF g.56205 m.56205 type:complete len:54 (+) comp7789_c0_seq3:1000-1161(+)
MKDKEKKVFNKRQIGTLTETVTRNRLHVCNCQLFVVAHSYDNQTKILNMKQIY